MSNPRTIEDLIHSALHDAMETAAVAAATRIVEEKTEGLSIEERLRRVEVQSEVSDSKVDALNRVASHFHKELSSDLDGAIDGLMSVIFEVVGHFLGRSFSEEDQASIQVRVNELYDQAEERGEKPTSKRAGRLLKQAVTEFLSRG